MGRGLVKTRSGFDSNQLENTQRPRCKEALKFVAEVLRDLTLLFWYTLPGPATNLRFYCLILARMVFYVLEATAFYAMTATIMAGADTDDPGVLVELTRLLLCSAAEQVEARVRRGTDGWQNLVDQVNGSNTELAEILRNLLDTTTRPSLNNYVNNTSASILEFVNDTSTSLLGFVNDTNTLEQTNGTDSPDINFGLTSPSDINFEPNDISTSILGFGNGTTLLEPTNGINYSDINLEFFGINNTGTITTDYNLGENTSAMASFLHQKYKFDFCAQIEDLNTDQTTITCISGLTWPLCAVFALALGSTVCGFALARIGRNPTDRRTGVQAGERVLGQEHQ